MNRIALITGATSGIGKASAVEFAKHNYDLILCGRRKSRLDELAANLNENYNAACVCLDFDIRSNDDVKKALNTLPDSWRKVDVLLNNAGLASGLAPIQEGEIEDWELMIDTNVKGLLYISSLVMPWMIERSSGHIINIGSIAGREIYPDGNIYCATKFAVDAITKAMRLDLLGTGIRVTQIAPGAVETEFSEVRFKGDKERAAKVYEGFEPLVAEDVAKTIYFVTSLPKRANVNDLLIMPTAQANARSIHRK